MKDAEGNLPIPHTSGQTPHAKRALQIAAEEGAPPSLARLYKTTHQHADGSFSHPRAEKIYNDVEARIQEVQTQLTQENPDGAPVQLTTIAQDKIFEQVVPKKRGRIVGIGSVNDVPRARAEYAVRMNDESAVRRELAAANKVIADNTHHFKAIASMFDMMLEANPNPMMASVWNNIRPTLNIPDPTPEEQADLHRRADQRSSEIFDEINLNN